MLATAVAIAGCSDEAEIDEVPEVAEVEVDDGEVRLEEEFPLDAGDIGKIIMATGTVVGSPLPNGFFLLTEAGQVLFVDTTVPVTPADHVRVVGPLGAATIASFDGWKTDALAGQPLAEWDVLETWYIDATSVTEI